ncbi:MAG: ribosome-associated translation inhibitor RaiA [Pseudomonadota bacterium]
MQIQVSGKDIDLGDALQTHVDDRMNGAIHKYFGRDAEGTVTFSREGHGYRCDCTVHLSSGIVLKSQGDAGDVYGCFEDAAAKMEKRVRRYKRRLKDHHAKQKAAEALETADAYILAPLEDETEAPEPDEAANDALDDAQPVVIAETKAEVRTMTVGMAVMQLDLAEAPAMVFKNAAHGRLNVVYKRFDGNVGWIDPQS